MTKRSQTISALQIRILLCFFLICACISNTVYAQISSPKNRFEVNTVKGCAPLTVTATNTFTAIPDVPIVWNFEWDGDEGNITVDPDASPQSASYEYTEPGTYRLLQVIGNINDPIDTLIIEVMEPRQPRFKVYNCINNTILLDFSEEDYYDELFIDFGDGAIRPVSTSEGSITHDYIVQGDYTMTVEGLFTDAVPNCGLADTTITTIQNLDIASLELVQVENEQEIQLAYNLADPDVSYRLEVAENGSSDFNFARIDLSGSSSAFTWNDPNINTADNYYCFRIVAVNRCDETLNQFSETVCSIALQASAEDLQNQLQWQSEGFSEYQVNRNNNPLTIVQTTEYLDTDVVCQEDYSYNITAEINGASSISGVETVTAVSTSISPAPSNVNASLQNINAVLSWPTVGDAAIYYIYRSEDGGTSQLYDSLQVSTSSNMLYNDPQELVTDIRYCYQITYRDACNNESERSEETCIVLPRQAQVVFPNAFTPNNDGLNDTFVYKANLLVSVRFQIFNRWGELLFSSDEIGEGWDGIYQGQPSPQGTYLFVLDVEDELGNAFSKSGKFTLLTSMP